MPPKKGGGIPVALVYPNNYFVGMSNLGYQVIYYLINQRDDAFCERIFYQEGGKTLSLETQRELSNFPLIGFSISYELDFLNCLRVLKEGGLHILAEERGEDEPIVFAGGIAVTANPEPLAPFFDFFIIGDGEEVLGKVMDVLVKDMGTGKGRVLEKLCEIEGVYVPKFYKPLYGKERFEGMRVETGAPKNILRAAIKSLDAHPVVSHIMSKRAAFGDMFLVEIVRGCPRQCKFCLASHICTPVRIRSRESALRLIEWGLNYRRKIGLIGLTTGTYPQMAKLCGDITERGGKISFASLGLDESTEKLLPFIAEGGERTFVLAPEAGTEKLRQALGKPFENDKILNMVERAQHLGIPNLKLYFMIGVPGEQDEDVEGIIRLAKEVFKIMRGMGGKEKKELTLSVNPFVPKSHTPFQWAPMADKETLNARIRRIERSLKTEGVNVIYESVKWSQWQGVLARGDRRLARVLMRMLEGEDFRRALAEEGLEEGDYLRARDEGEIFSWEHIKAGPDKEKLLARWRGF